MASYNDLTSYMNWLSQQGFGYGNDPATEGYSGFEQFYGQANPGDFTFGAGNLDYLYGNTDGGGGYTNDPGGSLGTYTPNPTMSAGWGTLNDPIQSNTPLWKRAAQVGIGAGSAFLPGGRAINSLGNRALDYLTRPDNTGPEVSTGGVPSIYDTVTGTAPYQPDTSSDMGGDGSPLTYRYDRATGTVVDQYGNTIIGQEQPTPPGDDNTGGVGGPPPGATGGGDLPPGGGTPPPGGGSPSWYSQFYQPGTLPTQATTGGSEPFPGDRGVPITTASLDDMAAQNRIRGAAFGDTIDAYTGQTADYQNAQAQGFQNWLLGGTGGYGNILQGQGGYSPTDLQNILQTSQLASGTATPAQLAQYNYTPQELSSMAGDPNAGLNAFTQGMTGVNNAVGNAASLGQGALSNMSNLYGGALAGSASLGQNALNQGSNLYGNAYANSANLGGGALSNMSNLYGGALSRAAAGGQAALGTLTDMWGNAIDPAKLSLSDEYTQNYNVTGRDMQNIRDATARNVQLNTQSERDSLERAAAAQGQTTPLALQSALTRRSTMGDINAASAATNADIAARQLGLTTTANREAMRLGSEQDIATRLALEAQNVGGAGLTLAELTGTQGLQAAQNQSNAGLQQAQYLGSQGFAGASAQASNALQQSQLLGAQGLTSAANQSAAGLQQAQLAGTQGINAAQYGASNTAQYAQTGDVAAAQRAADTATAKRTALTTQLGTGYGQAYQNAQYQGQVYQNAANIKAGQEQAARTYLGDAQKAALAAGQTANAQRIAAYGTQMGAINDPLLYTSKPGESTVGKIIGGAAGAANAYF